MPIFSDFLPIIDQVTDPGCISLNFEKTMRNLVNQDEISTQFNLLNLPWVNLVTLGFSPLWMFEVRCVAIMMSIFLRKKGKESLFLSILL